MHVESFIGNLGLWLGTLVRFIVETLNGLFGAITEAGSTSEYCWYSACTCGTTALLNHRTKLGVA